MNSTLKLKQTEGWSVNSIAQLLNCKPYCGAARGASAELGYGAGVLKVGPHTHSTAQHSIAQHCCRLVSPEPPVASCRLVSPVASCRLSPPVACRLSPGVLCCPLSVCPCLPSVMRPLSICPCLPSVLRQPFLRFTQLNRTVLVGSQMQCSICVLHNSNVYVYSNIVLCVLSSSK